MNTIVWLTPLETNGEKGGTFYTALPLYGYKARLSDTPCVWVLKMSGD